MKIMTITLLLISQVALAVTPLEFSSEIKNEALSEEAILLLHCLADESGSSWELSNAQGPHSLTLKETGTGTVRGKYLNEGHETLIKMNLGEAEKICREIYPKSQIKMPSAPIENDPNFEMAATAPRENKTWLWLSVGVATVAGFLLWKSQQPDHQSVTMH